MKDNPFEDVAVIALAPAASAPTQALIALCSLSTATNSVSTAPLLTKVEKYCGIYTAEKAPWKILSISDHKNAPRAERGGSL